MGMFNLRLISSFKNLFRLAVLIPIGWIYLSSSLIAAEKHTILGTNAHFVSGEYQIISDIKVSGLQIRLVRQLDSKSCANQSQHRDHIEMSGGINPDTPYIIEKLLTRLDSSPNRCMSKSDGKIKIATFVYLNSGGGYMRDGYKLGEVFRKHQVKTLLARGAECYSSCATAFLGGYFRRMQSDSVLMFHAPYIYASRYDIVCSKDERKLKAYMQEMLNKADGEYLYDRTMSYCSKVSGWTLNDDAAEIFGLLK